MADEAVKDAERQSNLRRLILPMGACFNCRKAKQKCIVEADPPCQRCLKSRRRCDFPLSRTTGPPRTQLYQRRETIGHTPNNHVGGQHVGIANLPRSEILVPPSHDKELNAYRSPYSLQIHLDPLTSAPNRSSNVPSVPAAIPPAPAVNGASSVSNNKYVIANNQQPSPKRHKTGDQALGAGDESGELPSEQDMEQLFEIFQERLLRFIPIFGPEDFEDFSVMLADQQPLIYSICFVTARFVPGGNAIRDKLSRPISDLLLGISDIEISTPSHSLSILQGFIVLYAYAQAVPMSKESRSASQNLLYWRIKTFTEAHAIQLFIHRAVEGLRAAVASHEPQISSSYCYKMYTYWLWLYTMSHYGSLATRTPPSIRADASIRAASKLLKEVGMSDRVSNVLKEVELCLSWEQASIQETQLGEWWCQPEQRVTKGPENKVSLDETQAALNRWSQRWSAVVASEGQRGSGLYLKDFYIRFVQFCITTYPIRPIKLNNVDGLLPAQKEAITKCVISASQVLKWALDLGPASKDRLRYLCDFGFVIISFCAFFILQAFQAFGPEIPQGDDNLDTVAQAAHLMTELAIDSKHAPAVYGSSIILLLEKVTNSEPRQSQLESNNLSQGSAASKSMNWMMSDAQGATNDQSSFVPDQTWDFASLFPDMLWN